MVACLVYFPRTGISSGPLPQQFYPDEKDGIKSPHDSHEMQPVQEIVLETIQIPESWRLRIPAEKIVCTHGRYLYDTKDACLNE